RARFTNRPDRRSFPPDDGGIARRDADQLRHTHRRDEVEEQTVEEVEPQPPPEAGKGGGSPARGPRELRGVERGAMPRPRKCAARHTPSACTRLGSEFVR